MGSVSGTQRVAVWSGMVARDCGLRSPFSRALLYRTTTLGTFNLEGEGQWRMTNPRVDVVVEPAAPAPPPVAPSPDPAMLEAARLAGEAQATAAQAASRVADLDGRVNLAEQRHAELVGMLEGATAAIQELRDLAEADPEPEPVIPAPEPVAPAPVPSPTPSPPAPAPQPAKPSPLMRILFG